MRKSFQLWSRSDIHYLKGCDSTMPDDRAHKSEKKNAVLFMIVVRLTVLVEENRRRTRPARSRTKGHFGRA
jgi:hypothetical protein